ncbi:PadR family transcriptional regulator [Clostridium sp.]|uniref:PadR family transcriptional regulator n=1 Tax=Clostridium sp. TaxID=1506 RepID=UPI002844DEC9|nr:PadR family transcriptional regulator [Clostridium sp.]MDR3593622.1 PadR family transcriptional regulator [Clostridium sp.]
MKVPFYILGLLMNYGPQHGYNIKQLISDGIADFAKIKLPTIYYHLEKLSEKGYVDSNVEKDGNRPERTVYSINDSGVKYFKSLLNKILQEEYTIEFNFDGILYYSKFADNNTIIKSLKRQQELIQSKLSRLVIHKETTLRKMLPENKIYCLSIFNHHIYHLETELKWIDETIKGLF